MVELAVPIPTVIISCVISTIEVLRSMQKSVTGSPHNLSLKRRATVTIILITAIFIVLNLPVFMLEILRSASLIGTPVSFLHTDPFMYWYSWGLMRVVSYAINATVNPIVYMLRIQRYRIWIRKSGEDVRRKVSQQVLDSGRKVSRTVNAAVVMGNTVVLKRNSTAVTPVMEKLEMRRRSYSCRA